MIYVIFESVKFQKRKKLDFSTFFTYFKFCYNLSHHKLDIFWSETETFLIAYAEGKKLKSREQATKFLNL
jgi:hypothetical protein